MLDLNLGLPPRSSLFSDPSSRCLAPIKMQGSPVIQDLDSPTRTGLDHSSWRPLLIQYHESLSFFGSSADRHGNTIFGVLELLLAFQLARLIPSLTGNVPSVLRTIRSLQKQSKEKQTAVHYMTLHGMFFCFLSVCIGSRSSGTVGRSVDILFPPSHRNTFYVAA